MLCGEFVEDGEDIGGVAFFDFKALDVGEEVAAAFQRLGYGRHGGECALFAVAAALSDVLLPYD